MKRKTTKEYVLEQNIELIRYFDDEFKKLHLEIHALKVECSRHFFNEMQKAMIINSVSSFRHIYSVVMKIYSAVNKKPWWRFW